MVLSSCHVKNHCCKNPISSVRNVHSNAEEEISKSPTGTNPRIRFAQIASLRILKIHATDDFQSLIAHPSIMPHIVLEATVGYGFIGLKKCRDCFIEVHLGEEVCKS